jgi:histidinol-phosphatase (PHP family)
MISYHGNHSVEYCSHASDPLEERLDAYVAAGYRYIGVTEHLPSEKNHLYPEEEAIGAEELENRFMRLMERRPELHRKYDRFFSDFRVGFETEYYGKDPTGRIDKMIAACKPEIVVASVHHVKDIPIDYDLAQYKNAIERCGGLQGLVCAYYDQQNELIKALSRYSSRFPVILGHMDLIKLFQTKTGLNSVSSEEVRERIKRNIKAAIAGGLIFEINARGIKKGVGTYPDPGIIELIRDFGGQITFGDDSHAKDDIGLFYAEAKKAAGQYFSTAVAFKTASNGGFEKLEIPF